MRCEPVHESLLTAASRYPMIRIIMVIQAVRRRKGDMVRKVTAMKVRDSLGELLDEVYYRGDEVVIERAGRAMAVLVPVGRYEQYRQDRNERFKILEQIKARTKRIPGRKLNATILEAIRAARTRR